MQDVTDPVSFLVIVHRIFLIQMIFSILQDHILACFILHANRKRRYFGEAGKWIVLGPHECHYSFFSVHLSIVSLSLTLVLQAKNNPNARINKILTIILIKPFI